MINLFKDDVLYFIEQTKIYDKLYKNDINEQMVLYQEINYMKLGKASLTGKLVKKSFIFFCFKGVIQYFMHCFWICFHSDYSMIINM
jgi:hypothetical protein